LVFRAGERCGLASDLSQAIDIATALDDSLAFVFLDGAVHTHSFGTDTVETTIASIQSTVPVRFRPVALKGLALQHTIAHARNPKQVVAFADQFHRSRASTRPWMEFESDCSKHWATT